jgi:hypothetical protein
MLWRAKPVRQLGQGAERGRLLQAASFAAEANCRAGTERPGQLGPGSHRRQLCNPFIEIRNHATGDEKPHPVSKTIQFARPIRDGECHWSAQRLWQISKNPDSQVIDLWRVMQDLGAVRISEQEHEPLIICRCSAFTGSRAKARLMPSGQCPNTRSRTCRGEPWVSKRPIPGNWEGSRCANASAIRCTRD